jgi:hypothetical protein
MVGAGSELDEPRKRASAHQRGCRVCDERSLRSVRERNGNLWHRRWHGEAGGRARAHRVGRLPGSLRGYSGRSAFSHRGLGCPFSEEVASDPGVFEADFDEADRLAQDQFVASQRKRHATQAQTLAELKRPLSAAQREDVDAHIRASAWNRRKGAYLEYLSLLVTLGQYRPAASTSAQIELRSAIDALPLMRKATGETHFLWIQPQIPALLSGMDARPDLLIATDNMITSRSVFTIREAKHKRLNAPTIRGEFGKAFDLHVRSCVIVSYHPVPLDVCDAARRLGIEVESLDLGTGERSNRPAGELARRLRESFDAADERSRFTEILSAAAQESESKELALRPRTK